MAVRISIGRYYSADSPIHRLDPRLKLIAAIIYMASCLFVSNVPTLLLAGVLIVLAMALARVPLGRVLSQIKPAMYFLVITSLFNLFFVHTGTVLATIGPFSFTTGGVSSAVFYTLRFLLLLLMGSLLMLTTQPMAITDAVERLFAPLERLGVPVSQATLILSIALRFVPVLSQDAQNIVVAQTARGAQLEGKGALSYARACVPLLVPLFASAVRHADNLGRAMDARCYTGGPERTHYHVMRFTRRDAVAAAVLTLYLVALAAASVFA